MSVIQSELDKTRELHNNHQIRPYSNQECPSGRPTLIYEGMKGAPCCSPTRNLKNESKELIKERAICLAL